MPRYRRIQTIRPSRLDLLPIELLDMILDFLRGDVESLSRTCKTLRAVSSRVLFANVKFEFSESGLEGMERPAKSDVRHHVISFTYEVPDILDPGKLMVLKYPGCPIVLMGPDIRDLDAFKEIVTPEECAKRETARWDGGVAPEDTLSWIQVFDRITRMCDRSIALLPIRDLT